MCSAAVVASSTACLVLAAEGRPYKTFIFSNVGNKAESPTIRYIDEVLKPYAAKHGIDWIDVGWVDRSGHQRDLYEELLTQERSINIPAYMPGECRATVTARLLQDQTDSQGIKNNAPDCVLGKGISTDEPHRLHPAVRAMVIPVHIR